MHAQTPIQSPRGGKGGSCLVQPRRVPHSATACLAACLRGDEGAGVLHTTQAIPAVAACSSPRRSVWSEASPNNAPELWYTQQQMRQLGVDLYLGAQRGGREAGA